MTFSSILLAAGLALLSGCLIGLLAYYRERSIADPTPSSMPESPTLKSEATLLVDQYTNKLEKLRHNRDVLSAYLPEYSNTMQIAGWSELVTIIEQLESAQTVMQSLLSRGHYPVAIKCAYLLLNLLPSCSVKEAQAQFPEYAHLIEWEQDTRNFLKQLAQQLLAAAKTTEALGISRRHRRKATIEVGNEILEALRDQ